MENSVCFIGHREIKDAEVLQSRLPGLLAELILSGKINFLFGDHSAFNRICRETVSELQKKYPYIRRIHFRTNYENPDAYTEAFLLEDCEQSIAIKGISRAGRAAYAERNQYMIRESDICIFYFDENRHMNRKSGTALAYSYACKQGKKIINLFPSDTEKTG